MYIDDVKEKLNSGNTRLRKRTKTVKREETSGVENKVKGTWIQLEQYRQESRLQTNQTIGLKFEV